MLTPLSTLLEQSTIRPGELVCDVPDDWMQGRSVYGGLQLALAAAAMRSLVGPELALRSTQMTFVGPVGSSVRITAEVARSGRNVTHVLARIHDPAGGTAAFVTGVFGLARSSQVELALPGPAEYPESGPAVPWLPGITPNCTQHFAVRMLEGGLLFGGALQPRAAYAIDLHDPGPVTELTALLLADYAPPLGLTALSAFAPGSTVTWAVELLETDFSRLGPTGWRLDAELRTARDGYTTQVATLWGAGGVPVAIGHQCMMVFG